MSRDTRGINRRHFLGLAGTLAVGMSAERASASSMPRPAAQTSARGVDTVYPIVETASGRVRGLSRNGVMRFTGVNYGASTAGPRRFLPPVKPMPWSGVRDALTLGYRSPQPWRNLVPEMGDALTGSGPMSEDCLCLHVWAPSAQGAGRPVMVYFHGGGDRTGAGSASVYDGTELARKHDLVVVTVNHRLNGFGFTHLADIGGSAFADSTNVGLLDLILALEWVRDNITAFGGDPARVTICGQSGGGGKVAYLLTMPRAKGLFHRAVVMSAGLFPPRPPDEATRTTELLLRRLGIARGDVARLREVRWERLLAAQVGEPGMEGGDLAAVSTPILDGRVLPQDPLDRTRPLIMPEIPVMTGNVETESVPYQMLPDLDPYWSRDSLDDDGLRDRVRRAYEIQDTDADRLIAVYRGGRPGASNADLGEIIAGYRDPRMAERWAAEPGAAPAYIYQFGWYSPVHQGRVRAMHCLDLPFMFDHVDDHTYMTGGGPERYALAERVSEAWAAFVRTGNPNHAGIPTWAPFNTSDWPTMIFNTECRAANDPFGAERRAIREVRARQA